MHMLSYIIFIIALWEQTAAPWNCKGQEQFERNFCRFSIE